jgi:hypothetical protein
MTARHHWDMLGGEGVSAGGLCLCPPKRIGFGRRVVSIHSVRGQLEGMSMDFTPSRVHREIARTLTVLRRPPYPRWASGVIVWCRSTTEHSVQATTVRMQLRPNSSVRSRAAQ